MDVAIALGEFASLLQIGSNSLKKLAASSISSDVDGYLREVEAMADRLREISRLIGAPRTEP